MQQEKYEDDIFIAEQEDRNVTNLNSTPAKTQLVSPSLNDNQGIHPDNSVLLILTSNYQRGCNLIQNLQQLLFVSSATAQPILTPQGSWIVRQSVGSTPCLLGKAVDCNYIRGQNYLEIDVDIGSSTVANGVLGLVIGVIATLVVDMAFLVQGNTPDELPERLIGAVRVSHIELSSAIMPYLDKELS